MQACDSRPLQWIHRNGVESGNWGTWDIGQGDLLPNLHLSKWPAVCVCQAFGMSEPQQKPEIWVGHLKSLPACSLKRGSHQVKPTCLVEYVHRKDNFQQCPGKTEPPWWYLHVRKKFYDKPLCWHTNVQIKQIKSNLNVHGLLSAMLSGDWKHGRRDRKWGSTFKPRTTSSLREAHLNTLCEGSQPGMLGLGSRPKQLPGHGSGMDVRG